MKQGIFTEVRADLDPATTTTANGAATRQPFGGNIIPKTRFSKVSANILPLIPDPTAPAVTGNYQYLQTSQTDDYIWSLKLDHSITQNHRVAFFLTQKSQARPRTNTGPARSATG